MWDARNIQPDTQFSRFDYYWDPVNVCCRRLFSLVFEPREDRFARHNIQRPFEMSHGEKVWKEKQHAAFRRAYIGVKKLATSISTMKTVRSDLIYWPDWSEGLAWCLWRENRWVVHTRLKRTISYKV